MGTKHGALGDVMKHTQDHETHAGSWSTISCETMKHMQDTTRTLKSLGSDTRAPSADEVAQMCGWIHLAGIACLQALGSNHWDHLLGSDLTEIIEITWLRALGRALTSKMYTLSICLQFS